jgi:DNA-binding transcriptional LysR family regulator
MKSAEAGASASNWTRLSIPLLQCFAAVYSEQSVTRAAMALRLPQSTVSTALARLRVIYSDALFVPGGGHLEPTTKAHEISVPILNALAELEGSLFTKVDFRPEHASAQIHIAMVDLVQYRILPKLVDILAQEAPLIRLSVTNFVAESVEHHLGSRRVDLAVASSVLSLRNVRYSQLYAERFTCLIRVGHRMALKKWSLRQFSSLSHIQVSPIGSTFVSMIDRVLSEHGAERHIQHFVPTYHIAADIVERSDYVALMPAWIADTIAERRGGVMIKDPPVDLHVVPVIQMWHERSQSDPLHRWLRQRLVLLCKSFSEARHGGS